MYYYGVLIVVGCVLLFLLVTWISNLFKKNGIRQDVEVLGDDKYKIMTWVYHKGDLIKKMEKITKGADAEKVVKEQREKGKNHYKLIKRFSK